jgi:serine protease Do
MRALLPLAVVAAASAVWAQEPPVEERVRRAVVRVRAEDHGLSLARSLQAGNAGPAALDEVRIVQPYILEVAGVLVSESGEVLTMALHPGAPLDVVVTFHDGEQKAAKLVGTDPLSNLALLRVDRATPEFLELSDRPPKEMDEVRFVGHGVAHGVSVRGAIACEKTSVSVQDIYGVAGGRPIALGSIFCAANDVARMVPGSACVDSDGRLLGLLVDTTDLRTHTVLDASGRPRVHTYEMSFCTGAPKIARILAALRRDGRVERAWFGLQLGRPSPALRDQFDLPSGALVVTDVEAASPALAAGVRRNDVLLSIDGVGGDDEQAMLDALSFRDPAKPASLALLRRGERIARTVTPERLRR